MFAARGVPDTSWGHSTWPPPPGDEAMVMEMWLSGGFIEVVKERGARIHKQLWKAFECISISQSRLMFV